jgi:uncharacterized protein (UPF0335 family)
MTTEGANGYDRPTLERLLTEIDHADDELASLKGEYMQSCKGPRESIKEVFEQAKEAGIPGRAFRTLVKNRRLDKQVAANVAKLEADQQAELEQLEIALGDFLDTELGQAAARRARPDQEAALEDLAAS